MCARLDPHPISVLAARWRRASRRRQPRPCEAAAHVHRDVLLVTLGEVGEAGEDVVATGADGQPLRFCPRRSLRPTPILRSAVGCLGARGLPMAAKVHLQLLPRSPLRRHRAAAASRVRHTGSARQPASHLHVGAARPDDQRHTRRGDEGECDDHCVGDDGLIVDGPSRKPKTKALEAFFQLRSG